MKEILIYLTAGLFHAPRRSASSSLLNLKNLFHATPNARDLHDLHLYLIVI